MMQRNHVPEALFLCAGCLDLLYFGQQQDQLYPCAFAVRLSGRYWHWFCWLQGTTYFVVRNVNISFYCPTCTHSVDNCTDSGGRKSDRDVQVYGRQANMGHRSVIMISLEIKKQFLQKTMFSKGTILVFVCLQIMHALLNHLLSRKYKRTSSLLLH